MKITPGYFEFPEGSALIEMGKTRVFCAANVQPGVPRWLDGKGQGWLTAEYAMLPRATPCLRRSGRIAFQQQPPCKRVPFVGRPLNSISFVTAAPSDPAPILARLGRRCRSCSVRRILKAPRATPSSPPASTNKK